MWYKSFNDHKSNNFPKNKSRKPDLNFIQKPRKPIDNSKNANIKENIEIYGKCPQCDVQFITINDCTYCPICYLETTNIFSKDTNSTNGIEKFKSTLFFDILFADYGFCNAAVLWNSYRL